MAWTDAHQAAFTVWRRWHPRSNDQCPKAHRGMVRAAVAEHGLDAVALVLEWAHEAPDDRARFLRGESDDSAGQYLGLDNLLRARAFPTRLEMARNWLAAGKPLTLPAAGPAQGVTPATGPGRGQAPTPRPTKAQRDQDSLDDLARWRAELDARRAALDAEDERSAQHGAAHPTNPASTPPKEFDHADAD